MDLSKPSKPSADTPPVGAPSADTPPAAAPSGPPTVAEGTPTPAPATPSVHHAATMIGTPAVPAQAAAPAAPATAPATPPTATAPAPAPSAFAPPSPSPFGPPSGGAPGAPGGGQPYGQPQPPANPWGPHGGAYANMPYPGVSGPPQNNGMAVAALVCGVLSVPIGFIPFFFWGGALLALVAIGLGIAGMVQASKGAPRKTMAIAGTVLGVLGLAAAGAGTYFTSQIVKSIDKQVNEGLPPTHSDPWDDEDEFADESPSPSPKVDVPGKTSALPFGKAFTYPDGVEVAVKEAAGYTPEPNKYDPDRPKFAAKVTVTITNNSKEKVELRAALPSARDDKGLESKRMYDFKVERPFSGSLLPGQSATGIFAFGLPEGTKGIQFEIAPGMGKYDGAIWSGTLG
ncbi:DUF4190 domain-containing protein [Streptomyces sp. NPDC098789]|uniref:DUF4190 domain-containing protein n=1 Tax=Streptomyces sp. NPDC098789 TaxID=3366098 RepID=UPI0038010814